MPIWLRQFTINKISKFRQEEKEAIDNAQKGNSSTSAKMGDPVPDHIKNSFKKASYATQKSKK